MNPLPLKTFSFSCLFLRQWCRDVASAIDRHGTEIYFRLQIQVINSSSLVSILFREVFSHPISFFHIQHNSDIIVIIIFIKWVFSECTEAITTSLIPLETRNVLLSRGPCWLLSLNCSG